MKVKVWPNIPKEMIVRAQPLQKPEIDPRRIPRIGPTSACTFCNHCMSRGLIVNLSEESQKFLGEQGPVYVLQIVCTKPECDFTNTLKLFESEVEDET